MKTGNIKTVKQTSVLLEMGIDFYATDLNDEVVQVVKKEVLEEIVRKNFNSICCPRIVYFGYFDKFSKTCRITVEEDLFV